MKQDYNIGKYPSHAFGQNAPGQDFDDEIPIDLRALFRKIWAGKWIIAISMILAGLVALLITSQMVPVYRSSAKVMFDLQNRNVVNVDQIVVSATVNENTIQNEIEVLRSTSLIERVIDVMNLERNPAFNPTLRVIEPTIFDQLRERIAIPRVLRDFLMTSGAVEEPAPPPDEEAFARLLRLSMVANLSRGLSLRPIKGSKVLEISYTSRNPQLSADIANTFASQYIVDQLESKLEATRTATSWLSERVDELKIRVQTAEEAIQSAQTELALRTGQSLEITKQQLQALNGSLSVARNATVAAQSKYRRLSSAITDGSDFGAISEFRDSRLMQENRAREADFLSQEISLRETVAEDHPAMIRLLAQLEEVRRNIRAEAIRIVEAARNDWEAAQTRAALIEQDVRDLETKARDQSRQEISIRQLEREAQASRALYENFLARMKETTAQEELQSADARILTPAQPALFPESQAKKRTIVLGLLIGAMSGLGIIFLLDKLNNTFRMPRQLETLSGENVLGTIPAIGNKIRRKDVIRYFRQKPKSSLAESLRLLRTSILFSNVDNPPKVVMFTSSVPEEGKSTTSMLIALTSRQMGKSAIIVDCDLRVPALARLLGAKDGNPGLLSVLEGRVTLDSAIFEDQDTGLHVLMTKPGEPRSRVNAADILSSKRFHQLIADLKARYDLVILDTPPALVVADSRILSKLADAVVYAVRWDHTPRNAVLDGIKELRAANAPLAGLVLTMVNESKASRYSYDGYSYYRGRYKKYYSS